MAIWQQPDTIVLWVFLAIAFVAILIVVLLKIFQINIKNQYENRIATTALKQSHDLQLQLATIASTEQERKRLAGELHDSLLSQLTLMRLQVQLQVDPEQLDLKLAACIADGRRISHALYPPMLEDKNLEDLLIENLAPWKKHFHVAIRSDVRYDRSLSIDVKLHLVRILQELCMNIHKHAQASSIDAQLRITEKLSVLYIADNGQGFNANRKPGLGLQHIQNRISLIDGKYKINHGAGTRIILIF